MGNVCCWEDVKKVVKDVGIVISCFGIDGNDILFVVMVNIIVFMRE